MSPAKSPTSIRSFQRKMELASLRSSRSCQKKGPKCCRKGVPFQRPKGSSCLILRNELSKETHVQIKQETLLGWATQVESSRVRESKRTARSLGFYGDGISFQVVSGQSF